MSDPVSGPLFSAAPGGPAGLALLLVLIGAWLLAPVRLALRRRAAAPGLSGAVLVAGLACATLSVQLGLLDALSLLEGAPLVQRRALLSAALEEAIAPLPAALALAALAALPHAVLMGLERPPRGALSWAPRLLVALAAASLLAALWVGWDARALYLELSPTLHQLDAPPAGVYRALVDEARPSLQASAGASLSALALAVGAGGASVGSAIITLLRGPAGPRRAHEAPAG